MAFQGVSLLMSLLAIHFKSGLASSPIILTRDYADEVCSPNTTSSSGTIPPCIEVVSIESLCAPNGTDLTAHVECMCGGSYFQEWQGCQECLEFHGLRTEREDAFYESVMSIASHSLCDFLSTSGAAKPTVEFASLFNSAAATAAQPTTGATVSSDRDPSQTAVSLYFTLSGSQGPGSFSAATTRVSSASKSTGTSSGTSTTKSPSSSISGATSTGGSSTATSSSTSGTYSIRGPLGLVLGLAGATLAMGF